MARTVWAPEDKRYRHYPPVEYKRGALAKLILGDDMNAEDVKKQALWELEIERFEAAVAKEKERLRSRKSWLPWRIRFINVNEVTK